MDIMLTELKFSRCDVDQAVFFKRANGSAVIVLVHVDDCTIAATSQALVNGFKAGMSKHVEITDLGELHWILGIKVKRDRERRTIHLSQRAYIDSIIRRYNFDDLKPASTPMQHGLLLSMSPIPNTMATWALMRDVPYREAVGSLMYAALGTRPDIAFAVQSVS
jgi:Reverse transcriptase (RNA-dependent DNA polymerase)